MKTETDKPDNAVSSKIAGWAGLARFMASVWGIMFFGAVGGVSLGFIHDNKFPLVPLLACLFSFCLAVPLGLLAKARKATPLRQSIRCA